jgi:hypothetical protein
MQDVQGVFEAIRESAERSTWSRAVEINRSGTVVGTQADGQHVVLDVSPAGALTSRSVTLYVEDEDWSCDCGGEDDPCEHVAAAVIALKRARGAGKLLPEAPSSLARIRYLFSRVGGALHFGRAFVRGESVTPFEATLPALQAGRVPGPPFLASQADLQVDVLLGMRLSGTLPGETLARLFAILAEAPDLALDGRPVKASKERVGYMAALEDQGVGFRLSVQPDESITEAFSNGVVLCGDTLHARGDVRLTGRELEEYRNGRYFTPDQRVELFTRIVPDLQSRIRLELRTKRKPKLAEATPRIELQVAREGDALAVLPLVVYGDPAVARVDAGELVLLGNELPVRDELAEERLTRRLKDELGLVPGCRERYEGGEGVAFVAKLGKWRGNVAGTAHEQFFIAPTLVPHLRVEDGSFDVWFDSADPAGGGRSARKADTKAVLRAFREGASLVPLLEGGWAPLPHDWMKRFGNRVADLLAAKEAREGELPASALPDLAKLCEALDQPVPPRFQALRPLLANFEEIPPATLPGDLHADLRSYQRRGVDWLSFLRSARLGALLADDMGLGKTLQALTAIEGPALVVAPTSVVFNWMGELGRFRPSLKCALYQGPNRKLDAKADVTITSYALLRLDVELLSAVKWKTVILDESQAIKNSDSQVARAAYRLRGEFRVALTGTPVENRLEELWSQFHFLNPGLLGGRSDFDERYAGPMLNGDSEAGARLRERIRPFVLRRLKREVAPELPPRTEVVLRCELGESERSLYEAVHAATREDVVSRLRAGGSVLAALEALLRLRQASCHPALLPGQEAETSAKTEVLLETLGEAVADGHKSLVFSQWTSMLDLLEPHLDKAGIPFVRLDGSTADRGGVVKRFQAEDGPPVMLISLKAGGAGLNLTAADHVFLVDPWWNPAVEDQAADRAHRIGQQRPVVVHRLVAVDTVEERILALQSSKRAIAEAALSGGQGASALTREDLLALLA